MSWRRPADENALALSFLDLLSCGLGAAALLFLVFSTVNRGIADARGRSTMSASAAGWQASGDTAPLEVIVQLPSAIDSRRFCWTGLERLNVQVMEGAVCDSAAPPGTTEPRREFTLIFPDGLPRHAFGVRLLQGTPAVSDGDFTVRARSGGEQRSYEPHQVTLANGDRAFSLNPRLWPASVKP